jgi:cytochrome c553
MNSRIGLIALLACCTAGFSASSTAADASRGKSLHNAQCMKCHDTGVYTRADRRIHSLEGLQHQVQRCQNALGGRWADDKVADVVQYLNENFYHFE